MNEAIGNGFDRIAPVYDRLTMLFYGNRIKKSQTYFLPLLPPHAKVLVMGGGTGWIIKEILNFQPTCRIWNIDISPAMLALAKKANPDRQHVTYILGTSINVPAEKFDVVIMPFFLDLFSMDSLKETLLSILSLTTSATFWLITDFVDHGKWWERIMLKAMYWFFHVTCSIEATDLPSWHILLESLDFKRQKSQLFYCGFIESHFYLRNKD